MDSVKDVHVELARIQQKIQGHLGLDSDSLVFEYGYKDSNTKLDLITINPNHNQSFLFHSVTGYDKVDAITKMLDYVKNFKAKESHYTIQWIANGNKDLHTSYFRASNISQALDKLYYGRDMNTITVFSVTLNPAT